MRLFRLLQLAAQAEMLRWRRTGRGYAIQAGFGVGAAVFGLMMLVMLHLAAMAWLAETSLGPVGAALVVAVIDLAIAGLLGFLATRSGLDPVAVEAERVRDNALRQVGDQTARAAVIIPMVRSASAKKGLFGAAVTALLIGFIARRSRS
jgi:putative superfamily III holin-X